jgi:hypothetical protein
MVWALSQVERPAVARLGDGSREALISLLEGFGRLARLASDPWLRNRWPEVLRGIVPVIRRRVLRGLRRRGADPTTEELADACLNHATASLAMAFGRIERGEFGSIDGMMAALHLHAELALSRRLAPFDHSPLPLPAPRACRGEVD